MRGAALADVFRLISEATQEAVDSPLTTALAERRVVPMQADFVGFVCPNQFVVGYGLDYVEKYRNLAHIAILDGTT